MRRRFACLLGAAISLAAWQGAFADEPGRMARKRPVYTPPPPPVVTYNWNGLYIGLNGGGGWGKSDFCTDANAGNNCSAGDVNSHNLDGWVFGGQLGWRYQAANWVFGLETMIAGANLDGDNASPIAVNRVRGTDVRSLYSITGSVGWAWDRWLFYVKSGWAGARADLNADNLNAGGFLLGTSAHYRGWTVGGGIEAFVWGNWSLGVEYNYYDLDHGDIVNVANTGGNVINCAFCSISAKVHTVTARLNYTFNWPPSR